MKLKDFSSSIDYARKAISRNHNFVKAYYHLLTSATELGLFSSIRISSMKLEKTVDFSNYYKQYYTSEVLQVRYISERLGKGVFSTKAYHANEQIYREIPVISTPKCNGYSNVCQYCLKTLKAPIHNSYSDSLETLVNELEGKNIRRCECGMMYCSDKCYELDKKYHHNICTKREEMNELIDICEKYNISHPLLIIKMISELIESNDIEESLKPYLMFQSTPIQSQLDTTDKDDKNILIEKCIMNIFNDKLNCFDVYGGWRFIYDVLYHSIKYNASTILPQNCIQQQFMNKLKIVVKGKEITKDEALCNDLCSLCIEGEGLYKYLNTLNHSCDPNCCLVNIDTTNQLALFALKDIQQGDELTISYIDNTLRKDERHKLLKEHYGFDCCCTCCTSSM